MLYVKLIAQSVKDHNKNPDPIEIPEVQTQHKLSKKQSDKQNKTW